MAKPVKHLEQPRWTKETRTELLQLPIILLASWTNGWADRWMDDQGFLPIPAARVQALARGPDVGAQSMVDDVIDRIFPMEIMANVDLD